MNPFAVGVAVAIALTGSVLAAPVGSDPFDTASRESRLAQHRLITSLARAGDDAVVAVGQRGHVLRSTDEGRTWVQAKVPVSSDLTAVQFVDARIGHAVGHDGVVLRSIDGGTSWTKVLDGREANRLVLEQMKRKVEAGGSDADRKLLDEATRNVELGPDKPFLDLWFANANEGFVVGAYNLILHTADGGKSWQPWFDRTDNPKLLNLYSIRSVAGTLFIAGEGGLLLKFETATQRFSGIASPYKGSWFGLLGTSAGVLAFGMRGNAFLSTDQGQSWRAVDTGMVASITAGDVVPDGRVLLADQAGNLALSRDGGRTFRRVALPSPAPLAAVAILPGSVVLGGPRGLRRIDLPKEPS